MHKLVYVIFMSTNILRPEMVGDRINVVRLWAKYHTVTYVLMFTFFIRLQKLKQKQLFHILAVEALISLMFTIYTECKRSDAILISKINFTVPGFVCETIMVAMRITECIVKGFETRIESIMILRHTSRCLNVILIYNESRNECKICTLLPQLGTGDFYILHGYVHYTSWIIYIKWNTILQQNNK